MIPYGKQSISNEDCAAVLEVLNSDYITQGPEVPAFEKAVANSVSAKYAIACSNGTSALTLACLALGVNKDSRVWTSPLTFVASANCARYCGASIDFVDVDAETYNLSVVALEKKLVKAKSHNVLPDVVIVVHFAGQSCEMEKIYALSGIYGFRIIEDAAHALGGQYKEHKVGCCKFSDISVFSFHPVKIITTGEGGMLTTNNENIYSALQKFRSHGITREETEFGIKAVGDWYYEQQALGYNFRMSDLNAALGRSQLKRLPSFVDKRHELAMRYNSLLSDLPVVRPYQHSDQESSWHLYVIQLLYAERKLVFDAMRVAGIGVQVHYIPVHTQPYYRELGFSWGDYPEAESYYNRCLTLPLYPDLSFDEQKVVVNTLTQVLEGQAMIGKV